MGKTEDEIAFGRIVVTAPTIFALLLGAVVKKEDVPTAHRRYGWILLRARMVDQLTVDGRDDKTGDISAHSMLYLESNSRESQADHSLKETYVHSVLECHRVDVASRPELLVVTDHDEVLAAGRERRYDVRFQHLGRFLHHNCKKETIKLTWNEMSYIEKLSSLTNFRAQEGEKLAASSGACGRHSDDVNIATQGHF